MAVFDVTEALSYLGKTVLLETTFSDPAEGLCRDWSIVHIVGVVLALEGVYSDPYFLYLDSVNPSSYPYELWWKHITTIRVLESRRSVRKARRT